MFRRKKIKIYFNPHSHVSFKIGQESKFIIFFKKFIPSRQIFIKFEAWLSGLVKIFYAAFYFVGLGVIKPFVLAKNFLVKTSYFIGNGIYTAILKILNLAKNDILQTKKVIPQRLRLVLQAQFAKGLLMFLLIAGVGWGALASLHLVATGLEIKNNVVKTAALGQTYLNQAKDAITNKDFSQAQNRFNLAYQTFNRGQGQIQESGQVLNQLLNLVPQKRDADNLLKAASDIADSGQTVLSVQDDIKSLHISPAGLTAGALSVKDVFQRVSGSLNKALGLINEANSLVAQVDPNNLPSSSRQSFADLKDKLQVAQFTFSNFNQVFTLMQTLVLGNKNILVLFENNNELRAGGGFMGTYGSVEIQDGNIGKINVSSIYDLDGQLREIIKPPKPVLIVNQRWYLRDSNWFADFPQTAKEITYFYETEGGQTPDVILALTPDLIRDWLKVTGPITLNKYGITLNSDNFVEQTQAASTLSNDSPTNSPKQILADLIPILIQKIAATGPEQWGQIIQILQDNLNQKQIVMYARDQDLQSQLEAFHWTGKVSDSDRDYLSIVSSNLGGTKTDLFIDQTSSLKTSIAADGTITDELTLTRTNKLPDLVATENNSFVRIFVPSGSKLISNIGFDYKNLEYQSGMRYYLDDDVLAWEKSSVQDVITGTTIGQEAGKTFFGNWITIKGGQSKTVKLVYQLPFKLFDVDRYSLLIQKQIGAEPQKLSWGLDFSGRQIDWKNFDTSSLDTSSLSSDIIVDRDYLFGAVLQKR